MTGNDENRSGDSRSLFPPVIQTFDETNTVERSGRPRGKVCRFLGKVTNGVITKISADIIRKRSNLKDSHSRDPVPPNVDHEGSLIPNIELEVQPATVQDASAGVKRGTDPQLVTTALQDARDGADQMNALWGPAGSIVSAGQNAPAALDNMGNMEVTYLQPLRIFDTLIGELANVHPYAKMALGVLSCASKIIIAQADRDEAILDLYRKLDFVDEHHLGTDLSADP
ncbi:uncharacterized protein EDB93DRAFT_1105414 [Suillus bovinus]|uniref:uncharacterized protein n=1 Tax=Suillus bovinus TaxID=48563 RepID=UPI001B87696B|nr:uncharacterized protein EDB93DRAFT_1105414 [Suillus bovinus]KAG2142738.1 hypothetical protein EDB93DRAFT_1105414 [Suillus bovinus]